MTALAILGSATSTSLASRGRSTIMDLPTPSARKRSLTGMLAVTGSAATGAVVAGGGTGAVVVAGGVVTGAVSAASTGVRAGLSTSAAAAENDRARTRKVRIA